MANENDGILRNNNNETGDNHTITKQDEHSKPTTITNNSTSSSSTSNSSNNSNSKGDYRNIRATSIDAANHIVVVEQQPRRDENPFSFKHFLNRDNNSGGGTTLVGSATISNTSLNSANILQNTTQHNLLPTNPTTSDILTTAIASEMHSSLYNNYTNNNGTSKDKLTESSPTISTDSINNFIFTTSTLAPISTITTATIASSIIVSTCTTTTLSSSSSPSYQTSTGARPKVPQSTSTSSSIAGNSGGGGITQQQNLHHQRHQYPSSSVSTTSMSSLINSESSKMKRSPRFSSFDSQASLAEYADVNGVSCNIYKLLKDSGNALDDEPVINCGAGPPPPPIGNEVRNENTEIFQGNDYYKMFIPRSYSNYDMDIPVRSTSSYTIGSGGRPTTMNNENNSTMRISSPVRPNRLSGIPAPLQPPHSVNTNNSIQPPNVSLPVNTNNSNNNNNNNVMAHCRPNPEFAAALPDFVQDHWMEHPWYFNEMHLHSPPNSPNRQQSPPLDFVSNNLPIGMANPSGGCGVVNVNNSGADICQTLPDFLSDGPIIHSSGRLADVAVGLPNLDSPEENSPSLQLSRIRLENDRLRRELDESRIALAEQTRRSSELERRLDQARTNESAFNRTLAQNIGQVEENLDQSKKRTAAAQNQVSKLKQQVSQLTSELSMLKRENKSLKEEGAVGGAENISRPSRNQQLSRDLRIAASNAENNLRQLLVGVDNLRLMAASIEKSEDHIDYDQNEPVLDGGGAAAAAPSATSVSSVNIMSEEFLSDRDEDFDDFSGPTL